MVLLWRWLPVTTISLGLEHVPHATYVSGAEAGNCVVLMRQDKDAGN